MDGVLAPIVNSGPGDVDLDTFGQSSDGLLVGDVNPLIESNPGDSPVHRTRVEVEITQPPGQELPNSAFARSGGAVFFQ